MNRSIVVVPERRGFTECFRRLVVRAEIKQYEIKHIRRFILLQATALQ